MKRVLIPPQLSAAALSGTEAGAQVQLLQGDTMGTSWAVKFTASPALALEPIRRGIQAELDRVVAQMSTWEPGSDLSRYNRAAAQSWQTLPEEFLQVLATALQVAEASGGAYDPTAGPLVNCWGFGPEPRRAAPPEAAEIRQALARVGWQRISLDLQQRRLQQPGGVYLDLSSIAKGYGVDQVARWMSGMGLRHFLVEVGGELRGQGCKPDGQPWWVVLERPADEEAGNDDELLIALDGLAVATSGDYRRYFESGAQRYSHTLDPRSGRPITHALASVSVIHAECMQADALSTALTVLGLEQGLAWAQQHGVAALFVTRKDGGFEQQATPAFAAMLE